jgi:hypothetical protein
MTRLARSTKVMLAGRVLLGYARVRWSLRDAELPAAVSQLGQVRHLSRRRHSPERLSRAVDRTLRMMPHDPTCLVRSLVLFRLMREQGDKAVLVIGLPEEPTTHEAHAWVELEQEVVGPPPGRAGHLEMARFA